MAIQQRMKQRQRAYAFIFYPESAPDNWKEILDNEHVCALISPLHDKDKNPDGSPKKPHYHILIMFEGVKSQEQVKAIIDKLHGTAHFETVNSVRGYARYLLHLDNPEKYQYQRDEIVEIGGADFDSTIHLVTDDNAMLADICNYIVEHHIVSFIHFWNWCRANNKDWFNLIATRHERVVYAAIKSNAWSLIEGIQVDSNGALITEQNQSSEELANEVMDYLEKGSGEES